MQHPQAHEYTRAQRAEWKPGEHSVVVQHALMLLDAASATVSGNMRLDEASLRYQVRVPVCSPMMVSRS
jgi:hypothetical protein